LATAVAKSAQAQEANPELIQLVTDLILEKDAELRAVGFEQVRTEAKGAKATSQFAALLPKLMPEAQIGLLRALGSRGDATAKSAVLDVLKKSKSPDVRSAAIAAVGELGNDDDLPLLLSYVMQDKTSEQTAALKSLARLRGKNINSAIAASLKNASSAVQVLLIDLLVTRRASDVLDEIAQKTTDAEATIRAAAMNALAQIGTEAQIPAMLAGVLKAAKGAERETSEKAVAALCLRLDTGDRRADAVIAARQKMSQVQQLELLPTLARVGGPRALAVVEAAFASDDPTIHAAGLEAYCKWPDASIAKRLFTLTQQPRNADERSDTFKAFVRVSSMRGDQRNDAERLAALKQAMSLAQSKEEKLLVISKVRLAYTVESLRYLVPWLDDPTFAPAACEAIVELAHHREIREPHKAEFDQVLDRVIKLSTDAVVKDRAQRYKNGQTWSRPKSSE
jgi:HEAT repeat protein